MHEETHQIQHYRIYIFTHQLRHQNLYSYSPTTSPEFIYLLTKKVTRIYIITHQKHHKNL